MTNEKNELVVIYPLFEVNISGIKCDNPKCGWRDDSVKSIEYPDYVNRPCPMCGENLLTEECFDKTLAIMQHTKKINMLLNRILPEGIKQRVCKGKTIIAHGGMTANGDVVNLRRQQ